MGFAPVAVAFESSTGADCASEAGNVPDLDVDDCNDGARDVTS
jgi:hypothetical protein